MGILPMRPRSILLLAFLLLFRCTGPRNTILSRWPIGTIAVLFNVPRALPRRCHARPLGSTVRSRPLTPVPPALASPWTVGRASGISTDSSGARGVARGLGGTDWNVPWAPAFARSRQATLAHRPHRPTASHGGWARANGNRRRNSRSKMLLGHMGKMPMPRYHDRRTCHDV